MSPRPFADSRLIHEASYCRGSASARKLFRAGLPDLNRPRLLARCAPVELGIEEVLCEVGDRIRHVYFPTGAFRSRTSHNLAKELHKVLQGFYNYHAVPGNLRRLWSMRYRLLHCWWRILRRRSQLRVSWQRYFAIVRTWLPEPRVLHPYPDARFRATHSR